MHILDFRVEKGFRIGRPPGKLTGMMDVFNALNSNPVTGFRTVTGARFKELIARARSARRALRHPLGLLIKSIVGSRSRWSRDDYRLPTTDYRLPTTDY